MFKLVACKVVFDVLSNNRNVGIEVLLGTNRLGRRKTYHIYT